MRKGRSVRSISTQVAATSARALAVVLACYTSGAAASEIVVTVAGPSSGPHSDRTAQMLVGARRAAADINATGGIKGVSIAIEAADDGCAAEPAKAAAIAISARKPDLIIGHPCAAAANAAAKIYNGQQTLFIATGSRHGSFQRSESGATIFRLSGRDSAQGGEAARYLAERFPGGAIAVVHDRTSASIHLADSAIAELKKRGAPEPITATVIGGDKDFPVLTAKIKSAAAIFYAGYPLEAGMLYAQLRKAGSIAAFLMSDSSGTDEFTDTFGARGQGVLVMRPRFGLQRNRDTGKAASSSVETEITNADSTLAAAAIAAYAAAANRADALNPASVARELAARSYETASGTVAFDKKGEALRPSYDVYRWTGSTWEGADIAPRNP